VCEDSPPREILTLLGDEHVQTILSVTSEQPMSASELSDMCNVSSVTIYRRLEQLVEHDLVSAQDEIAADGNHFKKYEATVEHIGVRLDQGEFQVNVGSRMQDDASDRFKRMWDDIRGDDS
jgi:predicted transcriptional regulator